MHGSGDGPGLPSRRRRRCHEPLPSKPQHQQLSSIASSLSSWRGDAGRRRSWARKATLLADASERLALLPDHLRSLASAIGITWGRQRPARQAPARRMQCRGLCAARRTCNCIWSIVIAAMAETGAAASNPELAMAERAGSLESLELNGAPEAAQEVGGR